MEMPRQVFIFDGQTHLDTFRIDLGRRAEVEVHRLRLPFEVIHMHADKFPFSLPERESVR